MPIARARAAKLESMDRSRVYSRRGLYTAVAALAGLLACLLLTIDPLLVQRRAQVQHRAERLPTSTELESLLLRIGLYPDALAASGVEPSQIGPIVERVVDAMVDEDRAVPSMESAFARSKMRLAEAKHGMPVGASTPAQLEAAKQSAASRSMQRDEQLERLFDRATRSLSPGQISSLRSIRENQQWSLPIEYLTVRRPESEWVELVAAATLERQCRERDEVLDPAVAGLLSSVRKSRATTIAVENNTHLRDQAARSLSAAVAKYSKADADR